MQQTSISKNLYKIFLVFTKYLPITLALVFIANLFCNYYKIQIPILSYIGGVSFTFIGLLYLIAEVFKFCHLFKIPLHYVTIGNLIGIIDSYGMIPVDNVIMGRVYFLITGIALITYIWFMYKNRNKPKIDHIKQLCDNYCDC